MTTATLPLEVWPQGITQASPIANDNALRVEALARGALGFENDETTSEPSDGDCYIVDSSPSGAFASFAPDTVVLYRDGTWYGFEPFNGWVKEVAGDLYAWGPDSSTGWQVISGGGGGAVDSVNGDTGTVIVPVPIGVACSDETTALTTGTAKVTFRMPFAMTLTAVRANVATAPTGSVLTVDINEGGVSILSTKITIDATEKTSTTAATPPVISDTALADDAEMTIDIDTVGSTIAGAGLKVWLIGYPA